jgi:hypothetical protein
MTIVATLLAGVLPGVVPLPSGRVGPQLARGVSPALAAAEMYDDPP